MKTNQLFSSNARHRFLLLMLLTLFTCGNAWGALTNTYTKVTSVTDLSAGDKVVLATETSSNPSIGVSGQNGTNDAAVSNTESDWVQYTIALVKDGSGNVTGWTLYNPDLKKYVQSPTGNHFKHGNTGGTCSVKTASGNGQYAFECNSRWLQKNSSYYRMYSSTNASYTPFYVWKVAAASYTITAASNNNSYGTVSLSGSVITAAPATCYEYASTAYTVSPSGKATVSQGTGANINKFTVSSVTADVTVTINFTPKASGRTVNFDAGPVTNPTSLTEDCLGEGITLPSVTASGVCKGWTTFAGWTTSPVDSSATSVSPLYTAGSKFFPSSNNQTLYAVYSKTKSGGGTSWVLQSSAPTTGDSIILAYYTGSAYKYMKNSGCDNDDLTVAGGLATPVDNGKFKIVSGSSNGVSLQSGTNYMHLNSSNVNVTTSQTNSDVSFFSGTSTNSFLIKRHSGASTYDRVLKWTGSNWTSTSTMEDACEVYFFKRVTSTTNYCSDPDCCQSLGSINGSILRA